MATIDIPKDVLDPIINAHVTKALTEVFGNGGLILQQVVQRVLTAKVNDLGEPDRYTTDKSKTTLEWMAHQAIKEAARAALKEALAHHQDMLRASIVQQLGSAKSPLLKSLAASLVAGVANAAANNYTLTLTIKDRE